MEAKDFVVSHCDMSLLADVYQELANIMFMLKARSPLQKIQIIWNHL